MGAALDFENLCAFETLEPGMGEVEGNCDPGNAGGREPFLGEPIMRPDAQISSVQIGLKPFDRRFQPGAFEGQAKVAKPPLEQLLV